MDERVMVDFFSGRLGWSKIFAARGWKCYCFDLVAPPDLPGGCIFVQADILSVQSFHFGTGMAGIYPKPIFGVCSSPCEQFSVWGMRHFHPNPPYPYKGIELFEHSRQMLTQLEIPFVMENVRAAQKFVGNAVHHCGPFYLWGTGVPLLMPRGIIKGMTRKAMGQREHKGKPGWNTKNESADQRQNAEGCASIAATIPSELANCVADYAERIIEQKRELVSQ